MTASTSIRDTKRAATREALHRAALSLFERDGFEPTTVDQIAHAAGVSRRTFFRYFESKQAVVFARQPARMAHFAKLAARGPGGWSSVRQACLDLLPSFERDLADTQRMHRVIDAVPALQATDRARDREWEDLIADTLVRGVDNADEHFARVKAGAVVGALRAVIRTAHAEEASLRTLTIRALDMLEDGVDGRREYSRTESFEA